MASFFSYKLIGLNEYNKYPGTITGFREAQRRYGGFRTGGGYETITIPTVEYYKDNDTINFEAGQLNYFAFYSKGENVTVLERKDDPYKTKLHTFWYYYMPIPHLIIVMLLSGLAIGMYWFLINY
ncbi:hypothetical protein AAEO56_08165 [Flavobacterium sp. DGU11]|uniref:DUF3592 domain-containing protein n=1 Tax=Flavobacterium arundinis TaxID=3139143 RepID=A0ABU9HVN8_9FLAO